MAKSTQSKKKTTTKTKTAKTKTTKPVAKSKIVSLSRLTTRGASVGSRIFPGDAQGLRRWNFILAALYAVPAVIILVLSEVVTRGVVLNFLTQDSLASNAAGHTVTALAQRHMYDMNIAYGIAAFLLIPAIAHLYMATLGRQRYEADLRNGTNRTRWIEYALSSSVLFMVVGLLSGVIDIASLKMLVGLNIIIHIAAYFAEIRTKRLQRPDWLSYSITCVAGALIWLVLALYVWGSTTYGQSGVAGYMWGVYAAIVVFCSAMAINIYMSLRGRGRWADYSFTERVFMLLAWAAKSAIAWQIFAGILN